MAFVSTWVPSGLNATPVMVSVCPRRVMDGPRASSSPPPATRTSNIFRSLSSPPTKTPDASAENATAVAGSLVRKIATAPLARRSHTRAEASSAAETTSGAPVGAPSHALTKPACPFICFTCSPTCASQHLTVLSGEHVTRFSPSAVQRRSRMAFLCP